MTQLTHHDLDSFVLPKGLARKKLVDGGGLYVLITKSGKCWRYNYRIGGKSKTLAFGVYPSISIEQARTAHQKARTLVKKGIDPSDIRREEKKAVRAVMILNKTINTELGQKSVTMGEADYLFELERQGIRFYLDQPHVPDTNGFYLTAMDLIAFREDPVLWLATRYGVNRVDYLAWMAADHQVQCSAFTKAGKRCEHIVKHKVDAKTFAAMLNARCTQH